MSRQNRNWRNFLRFLLGESEFCRIRGNLMLTRGIGTQIFTYTTVFDELRSFLSTFLVNPPSLHLHLRVSEPGPSLFHLQKWLHLPFNHLKFLIVEFQSLWNCPWTFPILSIDFTYQSIVWGPSKRSFCKNSIQIFLQPSTLSLTISLFNHQYRRNCSHLLANWNLMNFTNVLFAHEYLESFALQCFSPF